MVHYLLFLLAGIIFNVHALSQSIVKIFNADDPSAIDRKVQFSLSYFSIQENVYLTVIYTTALPSTLLAIKFYSDVTVAQNGLDYQVIKVRIDARLEDKVREHVLAHVMVHVKQYIRKELHIIDERQVTWKIEYHFKSPKVGEDINDRMRIGASMNNIGIVYNNNPKTVDKTLAYFLTVLPIFEEVKYNDKRAEQIEKPMNASKEIRDVYQNPSQSYSHLGDFKSAYVYETLFSAIKDTLLSNDEVNKIQQFQFNLDIDKNEAASDRLTKDQAVKEETIKRQKIVNYAALITGFLLLLVIGGFYNRYKYIRRTNKIIQDERDRSNELLLNILPEETARELETSGFAKTRYYDSVTVLFTDFKGFSTIAGKLTPQALVVELNDYFGTFDEIVGRFGLEKIKTIGDAYMCAGGIPLENDTHPLNAAMAALAMQEYMIKQNQERASRGEQGWELRIGIHTGPIVAGVVGKKKYAYDIWGDTVNVASRMESNGEPGKVNISSATYDKIKEHYQCLYRGKISAKNIGEVDMYFVESKITKPALELA